MIVIDIAIYDEQLARMPRGLYSWWECQMLGTDGQDGHVHNNECLIGLYTWRDEEKCAKRFKGRTCDPRAQLLMALASGTVKEYKELRELIT